MAKNREKKQFVVIGLGRFGSAIAQTLCEAGEEVLGVDKSMELIEDQRDVLTHVVQMDAMDRDALSALGVEDFDAAFVTMGSDIRASGIITLLLKELGAKYVIAKAYDEFHGRMLEKLGADQVLLPERDMGRRIAHNLISDNIIDSLELSRDYSMAEIRPRPEWESRTLKDLALRSQWGINVVAIRSGEELNAMPMPDTALKAGDVLLVVAREDALRKLKR